MWRTRPGTWRERLALRLIGATPVMANVRLDDAAAVAADRSILVAGVDLGEAYYRDPLDATLGLPAGTVAADYAAADYRLPARSDIEPGVGP